MFIINTIFILLTQDTKRMWVLSYKWAMLYYIIKCFFIHSNPMPINNLTPNFMDFFDKYYNHLLI